MWSLNSLLLDICIVLKVPIMNACCVCPSVHVFHLRYYSKNPIEFVVRVYFENC